MRQTNNLVGVWYTLQYTQVRLFMFLTLLSETQWPSSCVNLQQLTCYRADTHVWLSWPILQHHSTCPVFGVFPCTPVAHCHWQLKCTDLLDLEATELIPFHPFAASCTKTPLQHVVVYCACAIVYYWRPQKIAITNETLISLTLMVGIACVQVSGVSNSS